MTSTVESDINVPRVGPCTTSNDKQIPLGVRNRTEMVNGETSKEKKTAVAQTFFTKQRRSCFMHYTLVRSFKVQRSLC